MFFKRKARPREREFLLLEVIWLFLETFPKEGRTLANVYEILCIPEDLFSYIIYNPVEEHENNAEIKRLYSKYIRKMVNYATTEEADSVLRNEMNDRDTFIYLNRLSLAEKINIHHEILTRNIRRSLGEVLTLTDNVEEQYLNQSQKTEPKSEESQKENNKPIREKRRRKHHKRNKNEMIMEGRGLGKSTHLTKENREMFLKDYLKKRSR
jgi:hypothetical protein